MKWIALLLVVLVLAAAVAGQALPALGLFFVAVVLSVRGGLL